MSLYMDLHNVERVEVESYMQECSYSQPYEVKRLAIHAKNGEVVRLTLFGQNGAGVVPVELKFKEPVKAA